MTFYNFQQLYPNIGDLHQNPAFHEPKTNPSRCMTMNNWTHFWNLTGARGNRQPKYVCAVCGCPIKKRAGTYRVCKHHLAGYLRDMRRRLVAVPALFCGNELKETPP